MAERDNRTELVTKLKTIFGAIRGFENDRDEVNASIAEQYAKLKRMGFSVKAARASLARYKLEEDARELWDETFDITAEALGVAIEFQPDFFDDDTIFNPKKADEADEEKQDEDPDDEETTHLSPEELAAAAEALNHPADGDDDEQAEGDRVLTDLAPETAEAQALATKH